MMKKYKKFFSLGMISLTCSLMVAPIIISCGKASNANAFKGKFVDTDKSNAKEVQEDFMTVKDRVINSQFIEQFDLTGVILNQVIAVGLDAFKDSPLTELTLPKVGYIALNSFGSIVNLPTTIVTLPKSFKNGIKMKNDAFGPTNWNKITFIYV